jgi:hypothetical protein
MTKPLFIFVSLLALILGLRLFLFYPQKVEYKDGQSLSFTATITADPKFSNSYQNLSVNLPTGS